MYKIRIDHYPTEYRSVRVCYFYTAIPGYQFWGSVEELPRNIHPFLGVERLIAGIQFYRALEMKLL